MSVASRLGVLVGVGVAAFATVTAVRARTRRRPFPPAPYDSAAQRILVLGGGFAGLTTARTLAKGFGAQLGIAIRVVDAAQSMTFWPMVPEVISGSIQAAHVLRPLREELVGLGIEFIHAKVIGGDLGSRVIETDAGTLPYDKVVIALGWETAFFGTQGAREHCFRLESLSDAVAIRNRVVQQFEAAASGRPGDLCFVVVGGGSTGVELAASLADLMEVLLPQYPSVGRDDVRLILTQAKDDVLPHMEEPLRQAAAGRLRDDRIDVRTDSKVSQVDERGVTLANGARLESSTVIWAAGVQPTATASRLTGADLDHDGRLQVDRYLRLHGRRGAYALGDNAAVTSGDTVVAPTAQAAVQEAAIAAANLLAEVRGGEPTPFVYRELGHIVDLGGRFAVSQVLGARVSGWAGKLVWRAVYLSKLGDWRDRMHVASDWLIRLLEPPSVPRVKVE